MKLCLTDVGKVGDRSGIGQAELGNSDHLCDLHNLPGTNAGDQCSTVEVTVLQKASNAHPLPVDSCELIPINIHIM